MPYPRVNCLKTIPFRTAYCTYIGMAVPPPPPDIEQCINVTVPPPMADLVGLITRLSELERAAAEIKPTQGCPGEIHLL